MAKRNSFDLYKLSTRESAEEKRLKKFTIQILNVKTLTNLGQKPDLFPVIGRKIKPFPKATNKKSS